MILYTFFNDTSDRKDVWQNLTRKTIQKSFSICNYFLRSSYSEFLFTDSFVMSPKLILATYKLNTKVNLSSSS